ncbi:DUF4328 domain-containing protein [Streptosporangiaceae bacterium NEAU-GS5]|nr:DUF4328 domain-containing protein [Streptosporangiaceae bacterium NEAU-GS5]
MHPPANPNPAPPSVIRPIQGLGVAAYVTLAVATIVNVAAALVSAVRITLLERYLAGDPELTQDQLTNSDNLTTATGVGQIVALVAAGVVFTVWLWRARVNSEAISPQMFHRHGRSWVILGWIVPIGNLVIPPRLIRDVWRASGGGPGVGLIAAWWLFWLADLVLGRVVSYGYSSWDTAQGLRTASLIDVYGLAPAVIAAGCAAAIVLRITEFQENARFMRMFPPLQRPEMAAQR